MRKVKRSGMAIGILSLMMILGCLMLTLFAILSVMTVQADLKLNKKNLQYIQSYYDADFRAGMRLAEMHTWYQKGVQPQEIENGEIIVTPEGIRIIYSEGMDVGQKLEVEVLFLEESLEYRIERWQVVNEEEWIIEEGILFNQIDG